jgi:hypothetical protein
MAIQMHTRGTSIPTTLNPEYLLIDLRPCVELMPKPNIYLIQSDVDNHVDV